MNSDAKEAVLNHHEFLALNFWTQFFKHGSKSWRYSTNQAIKELNLLRKTAVDKIAWTKAYYHSMVPS